MLRHTAFACLLLFGALAARPSSADLAGPVTVIDGDTIVVAGERVRLEGIDAPELRQECTAYGQPCACGRTSAKWLKEHLNGRQVACVRHARDRYGRRLAVCYVGGESINERMVREGWALDYRKYSSDYLQAEADAKRAGAGTRRVHPALGVAEAGSSALTGCQPLPAMLPEWSRILTTATTALAKYS